MAQTDDTDDIVAIGLLTEQDLSLLGSGFRRAFRIDDTPCFEGLLAAIDRAEQEQMERARGMTPH